MVETVKKRSVDECLLSEYLEKEGRVNLTLREAKFVVPLLVQFRKEHRRWEREGRKATGRVKLDRIGSDLEEEVLDPNRRALFINLTLTWGRK